MNDDARIGGPSSRCTACGHALRFHKNGRPAPRPSSTACRGCSACDREQNS